MDTDHLRRLFDAGRSFREAFDAACHSDTAYAVEAFALWVTWEQTEVRVWQELGDREQRVMRYQLPQPLPAISLDLIVEANGDVRTRIPAHPIGASDHAVCWLLRDEWAGLPPGVWCRDGRSSWLVPGTQTMENAR